MVKKIRIILRVFLYVIMSLAIGFTVYLLNAKIILRNALPTPFGYGVGVVVSGSMEPEISVDDVIVVKKTSDYKVGDIVVYQDKEIIVVHKIVKIEGEYVITRGTANDVDDTPIKISELKGEVIKVYEDVGEAITFFQSPSGSILIVSIALLLLLLSFHVEKKEEQKELNKIKEEIENIKNNNK